MRRRTLVIVFIAFIAAAYVINSLPVANEDSFVTKVVDGDTIVVEGGRSVRLLSIDTRERGENCYREAKERLEELVLLKSVTLERDNEDRDRYDRLLRYVYVDGALINLQMVEEGLAVVYIIEPNVKYRSLFVAAEEQARSGGGCVWDQLP